MDMGLAGKTVVVTGATANIGRAIALEMAQEGVNLVAVGRDTDAGARVVAAALARGAAGAGFVAIDLLERDAGERIRQAAANAFGPVDVLVNNVGGNASIGVFAQSDPDGWQHDIDLNLISVLRTTRAILPDMIARKSGNIVNIGSTAGTVGDYMLAIYSAAKSAVHGFTKVLAKEVGQHGIRVNCVAPYATVATDPAAFSQGSRFNPRTGILTQGLASVDPSETAKLHRTGPLERTIAQPEEVAAAVVYFASNRANFITGQVFHLEGGTLL